MNTIIKMKITRRQLNRIIRESFIDARERFRQAGQKNRGTLQRVGGGEVVAHPGTDFRFPNALNIFDLAVTQARALKQHGQGNSILFKNLDTARPGELDRLMRLFVASLSRLLSDQGIPLTKERKARYFFAADSFTDMIDGIASGGPGIYSASDSATELLIALKELQVL